METRSWPNLAWAINLMCKLLGARAYGTMRRRTMQERGATVTGSKRTWGVGTAEQEINVREAEPSARHQQREGDCRRRSRSKTASNLSLRWVPTVLCLSATLGSGDSFTDRSPPGMARSNLGLRWVSTVLRPSAALESCDGFTDRSPPEMA
eukprot:425269-Pyramimonas_sp.AAC.1